MVNLKLWLSPGSCSLAPHILLRESGLEFELMIIDITSRGGFPEEYEHMNPNKKIPILEIDGEIVTETVAVMTAISQLAPDKHLFGSNPLDVVRTYEWLNWLSGTLHERGFGAFFSPGTRSDDSASHAGIRKKSKEWIVKCMQSIDAKLTGEHHATSSDFTAADAFLYVIYRWGYLLGMEMDGLYPNWARVVANVASRKSTREAAETEGIPLVKERFLGIE